MSSRIQKVLIIQDASRELSVDPIRGAVHHLSLKPGDKMKILRIVQPFRKTSSRSPLTGCGLLAVSKSRLHSSATILKRQESIDTEIRKKLAEFETNREMKNILSLMRNQQIEIETAVEPGHLLKEATVHAANNFDATCVILDRKLKGEIKYIMENLTCGIMRMRKDGGVKFIRAREAPEPEDYQFQELRQFTREQRSLLHQNSMCSVCFSPRHTDENVRAFTLEELQCATVGFSEQNLLSNNNKLIYKGILNDGTKIAISSCILETTSYMQFRNRVELLQKARHKNVVSVLGSYSEELEKRLLVCEYVCNGSLNTHLSNGSTGLTWERRVNIALGSARGLQYLHSKSFYGSMRPDNILLTHDYEPLLTNYGTTRDQYHDMDRSSETRVLKTFDYLAPEYEETVIHSSKTDVYSFGLVLLQLITGWKTLADTHGKSLLAWARPLLREKNYPDLLDRKIGGSHDILRLFWMVRIAEKCLSTNPYRRYSIDQVRTS
ncbi:hypothetical protein ACET3Z_023508 [Daucus carota]